MSITGINPRTMKATINYLCRTNFLVFMRWECGFEVGDHHKEWWEELQTDDDCVFLSPRDHGKSFALARAYPIWKAKYHSKWIKEILILGADSSFAQDNLAKLKDIVKANPRLQYLYPKSPRLYRNTRSELELTNGVFIKAKGYLSPLRGRHPQLIILDDVLNEKNSLTDDQRFKVEKFFYEVVLPMKDRGTQRQRAAGFKSQIVKIGTAQHYKDLGHKLLVNPGFRGRKQRAILDEAAQKVLWPERYPFDALDRIRKVMGSLGFSKEYLNEPINDDTSLFPVSLFEPMFDHNLSYRSAYNGTNPVYMGVDFNVPGDSADDYTVVVSAELDKQSGLFTLLDYKRFRASDMNEQTRAIEVDCKAYEVSLGYLEDNMFQKVYTSYFSTKALPLQGHTVTAQEKNSMSMGILSFRPLFENRKFRFPYQTDADKAKTDLVVQEFTGMVRHNGKIANLSFHDDIVMAMWHMLCASGKQQFSYEFLGTGKLPGTGIQLVKPESMPEPAGHLIEDIVMNELLEEERKRKAYKKALRRS